MPQLAPHNLLLLYLGMMFMLYMLCCVTNNSHLINSNNKVRYSQLKNKIFY